MSKNKPKIKTWKYKYKYMIQFLNIQLQTIFYSIKLKFKNSFPLALFI